MEKEMKKITNVKKCFSLSFIFAIIFITPAWAGPHNPILWQLNINKTPVTVYFPEEHFPYGRSFPKSRLSEETKKAREYLARHQVEINSRGLKISNNTIAINKAQEIKIYPKKDKIDILFIWNVAPGQPNAQTFDVINGRILNQKKIEYWD
jgi:hypothetical protein